MKLPPSPSGPGAAQPPPRPNAIPRVLAVWLGFLTLLNLPYAVTLPFGRDQGIYAQVALKILEGGLPYANAWDHKGPLSHFLFALPFWIAGPREAAYQIFFLGMLAASLWFAARVVTRLSRVACGALTAMLLLSKSQLTVLDQGQPDTWVALLVVWIAGICLHERWIVRPLPMAALGVLCAAAAWIKPPFGLLAGAPLIAAATLGRLRGGPWLRQAGWFAAGVALCSMLVLLPFLCTGTLRVAWDTLVGFNLQVHVGNYSRSAWGPPWPVWGDDRWVRISFWLALPKFFGAVLLFARDPRRALPLSLLWFACYLAVGAQRKFWPNHFVPMEFAGSLFSAYFLSRLVQYIAAHRRPVARPLSSAIVLVALLSPLLYAQARWAGNGISWWTRTLGWAEYGRNPRDFADANFSQPMIRDAAQRLRERAQPGDRLYVWGFESLLYMYAKMPSPTRFDFSYPLIVAPPGLRARMRTELMDDLRESKPAFIAVQDKDNGIYPRPSARELEDFAELRLLLASNYQEFYRNTHFTLHQRRDPQAHPDARPQTPAATKSQDGPRTPPEPSPAGVP